MQHCCFSYKPTCCNLMSITTPTLSTTGKLSHNPPLLQCSDLLAFPPRHFPEGFYCWWQLLGESRENEPVLLGITCKNLSHHWPTYPGHWREEQCKLLKKPYQKKKKKKKKEMPVSFSRHFSTSLIHFWDRDHTAWLSEFFSFKIISVSH